MTRTSMQVRVMLENMGGKFFKSSYQKFEIYKRNVILPKLFFENIYLFLLTAIFIFSLQFWYFREDQINVEMYRK